MENMPIGGYFELELANLTEYHDQAIKLNSGRNCLIYFLSYGTYKKIYLPYYICNDVVNSVESVGINYVFYFLDTNMMPLLDRQMGKDEILLYINYFGVNGQQVKDVLKAYGNVIIDNSQAFFEKSINDSSAFCSPRKFFGVPDGGYLYCNFDIVQDIERGISFDRCSHLLQRLDTSPQQAYEEFLNNEKHLSTAPISKMSCLTERILRSINYDEVARIRRENFIYLHDKLKSVNDYKLIINCDMVPMVYPLLIKKDGLRDELIRKNIFLATYWKEVLHRVPASSFEHLLTKFLLPLPLDQRYCTNDMNNIVKTIKHVLASIN